MASPENQPSASRSSGSSAAGVVENASSKVSDLAHQATEQVRDQASRAAGQAQERTQAFLSEQKEVAAEHIDGVAKVLHDTVDQLRERSPGAISDYAERAVDSLDSIAQALREQDVRSLVGQVEDFARRQPVLFIAGSVGIGFALARFLKSSSHTGYGQGSGRSASGSMGSTPGYRSSSYRGGGTNQRGTSGTEYGKHMTVEPESTRNSAGTSGSDYQGSGGRSSGQESR